MPHTPSLERIGSSLLAVVYLAALVGLAASDAHANCALIPSALAEIPSEDGAVDRPFAGPGDTVTILSDSSCKPGPDEAHFDPIAANNVISLTFEPPSGGAQTTIGPITPSAVLDCGDDRCFALEFVIPDTTAPGETYPLTGPARIQVDNVAASQQVAEIGALFRRARGCNPQNRVPNLFVQFTVLPPPNTYDGATTTLDATVDGSGSILIPMDYGSVLASPVGNDAAVRLLNVDVGDFPNGLAAGNGLDAPDDDQIRIPRDSGRFLRSFSQSGRPIPPLLKITASTPLVRASDGLPFGDTILGTVDFVGSVLRISREEPSPLNPAVPVPLFSVPKEAAATTGLALLGGIGPIELTGATLSTGAAAPLNSLNASDDLAVVARSASLDNPATPSEDLVVEFTSLDDGAEVDTGMSVVETARSPRKPVISTAGSIVAFFQSETDQGFDFNGDGNVLDSIFRVWTADASHPSCSPGGQPCDLSAAVSASGIPADPSLLIQGPDSPSPVVVSGIADPGRYVFFAASETDALPPVRGRFSLQYSGAEATQPSVDATISSDGNVVGFASNETDIVEFAGPVARPGPVAYHYTGNAFDTFGNGTTAGAYGPSNHVTVTLLRDSLLPSNLTNTSLLSVLGGRNTLIYDGRQLVASRNNNYAPSLLVSTDGAGNITEWNIQLGICGAGCSILTRSSAFGALDASSVQNSPSSADTASVAGNQGSWVIDTTPQRQVYVRDRTTLQNELISVSKGIDFPGDEDSGKIVLDAGGNRAAFESEAANLIGVVDTPICCPASVAVRLTDVEGHQDVYLTDRLAGAFGLVYRLSENAGVGGDGDSSNPDISNDGLWVAYQSFATNLVPGDTNGVRDIFVSDESANNTRVSVSSTGEQANSSSAAPALSADGNEVVFFSGATNLVPGDTNGVPDVFLHDRADGTTERISVGYAGAEADAISFQPGISHDGRWVVFQSRATNLVPPGTVLNDPQQCYVHDRLRGRTELVSASATDEGGNAPCRFPEISASGRYVTFASSSTNLSLVPTAAVDRIYLFDRLTGAIGFVNEGSAGATGSRSAMAEGPLGGIVFDTAASDLPGPPDTNGLSDVYGVVPDDAASTGLNTSGPFADIDNDDAVLFVLDTEYDPGEPGPVLTNTGIPVSKLAVAGGRAIVVPHPTGGLGQIWDAEGGSVRRAMNVSPTDVAISETIFCALDEFGQLAVGPPSSGVSVSTGVAVEEGLQAAGDRCVFIDTAGQLGIAQGVSSPALTTGIASAEDFQVSDEGIAFRTCEGDTAPPADLNGDTDADDCVMRFWDFATASLTDTGHTADLCTFPGCDPFFRPYKLGPGIVSFVTFEVQETDSGGSDALGTSCLSTSLPGVCDKTGDRDGNDAAIEIYSLRTGKAQVFPIDVEVPPEVEPFPTVTEGDTGNVMTIQLPASVLGDDFASEPPDRLITVLVGDPEGDGVFEADGNLDPQTAVVDRCAEEFDPDQVDADGDGMAEDCDFELGTQLPNDDPVTSPPSGAPQIPGSDPTQLCNLNSLQDPADVTITRAEVDQVWRDRGTPISAPADLDGLPGLEATDLRDKDADGAVTAVDFRLCLAACDAQAGGCPLDEPPAGGDGGFQGCGLLGVEALLVLAPLAWRRRRTRRAGRSS